MHKYRGTLTFAPNFAYALVTKRAKPEQIARWDLSRVRVFGCGAEPINPHTMRAFVDAMAPAGLKATALLPCYGMAEATLAISFVGLDEPLRTDRIDAERYHGEATGGAGLERVGGAGGGELRADVSRARDLRPGRRGTRAARPAGRGDLPSQRRASRRATGRTRRRRGRRSGTDGCAPATSGTSSAARCSSRGGSRTS